MKNIPELKKPGKKTLAIGGAVLGLAAIAGVILLTRKSTQEITGGGGFSLLPGIGNPLVNLPDINIPDLNLDISGLFDKWFGNDGDDGGYEYDQAIADDYNAMIRSMGNNDPSDDFLPALMTNDYKPDYSTMSVGAFAALEARANKIPLQQTILQTPGLTPYSYKHAEGEIAFTNYGLLFPETVRPVENMKSFRPGEGRGTNIIDYYAGGGDKPRFKETKGTSYTPTVETSTDLQKFMIANPVIARETATIPKTTSPDYLKAMGAY